MYTYGLRGAPAVGGGLPGLPQRQTGGGGISSGGAIPVDTQFGYADEQPANAVEVGAIVEREDYPALSELIPHAFEQTVQMPMVAPSYTSSSTPVVALSEDGSLLSVNASSATAFGQIYSRTGDSFASIGGVSTALATCCVFSKQNDYLYRGINSLSSALQVIKISSPSELLTTLGGTSWPVKLLAVSPDGTLLAAASSTTSSGVERVKLWRRSGDTFTAVTLPASVNTTVYGLEFSKGGKYLYVSQNASPFLRVFDVSGSTPSEVAHGVGFSSYRTPFVIKTLTDDAIFFISTSGTAGKPSAGLVKRSGASFSLGAINPSVTYYLVSSVASPEKILDLGAEGVAICHRRLSSLWSGAFVTIRRNGDMLTQDDGNHYLNGYSDISYASISGDSKFLALGLSASPWLLVYGSDSKMVARLNERSPTGQKLYMKAG